MGAAPRAKLSKSLHIQTSSGGHSTLLYLNYQETMDNDLQFLKKQHLSSGAMMQLNFSKSGLAFAISSDENITLKSPLSKPLITMDSKTIT